MPSPHRALRCIAAIVVTAAALVQPAFAHERDHDRAREAVRQGEIRPLAELLDDVRPKLPGEIVRMEIERRHGRWVYEFRVIDGQGRLYDVHVDASSGEILRTKEK